jgi:hypothetical protein
MTFFFMNFPPFLTPLLFALCALRSFTESPDPTAPLGPNALQSYDKEAFDRTV